MPLLVRTVSIDQLPVCIQIRRVVFIEGQDVPEDLEVDGLDPVAQHFLATLDSEPVGTARMRVVDGVAKAERVAVLAEVRGLGVGKALMLALHDEATRRGLSKVKLSAQVSAIPFYDRLGYEAVGPVYLDAGIDHRDMWFALSSV